jgi:hypothetical protein
MRTCPCGSGEARRDLIDARGIFCTFVCDKCETRRQQEFRPDTFTDADYWADEPIEED